MFRPRDVVHGAHEVAPDAELLLEHFSAVHGQPVITPPALAGLLHPAAVDEAALFEAVEQGIEGSDVEAQDAAGAGVNQLAELIAVPRAVLEQRQDEQLGAAFLQLAVEHLGSNICHSDICWSQRTKMSRGKSFARRQRTGVRGELLGGTGQSGCEGSAGTDRNVCPSSLTSRRPRRETSLRPRG